MILGISSLVGAPDATKTTLTLPDASSRPLRTAGASVPWSYVATLTLLRPLWIHLTQGIVVVLSHREWA
ncbi:hypothetical protein BJY01DRAFT_201247 [Aspergillus pseudoustus]|uniref:Uncharacterized protein n=1 Tax=Aspergillus pseudoustus TaxID=1810923 RepID=A0ABR4L1Q0_9EURO